MGKANKKLRLLISLHNLKFYEVANLIGCDTARLSGYLNGYRRLSEGAEERLAKILGITRKILNDDEQLDKEILAKLASKEVKHERT